MGANGTMLLIFPSLAVEPQVKVASMALQSEVGRTANAVHHLRTENFRGVDMAIDVHLDGRVERTDAETGNDFRTVGDFRWANQEASAIVIDVLIEVFRCSLLMVNAPVEALTTRPSWMRRKGSSCNTSV